MNSIGRDLRYHLDLLDDQTKRYGDPQNDEAGKTRYVREIANISEALTNQFSIDPERLLDYTLEKAPPEIQDELRTSLLSVLNQTKES